MITIHLLVTPLCITKRTLQCAKGICIGNIVFTSLYDWWLHPLWLTPETSFSKPSTISSPSTNSNQSTNSNLSTTSITCTKSKSSTSTVKRLLINPKLCQFHQPCHPAGQVTGAALRAPRPLQRRPYPPVSAPLLRQPQPRPWLWQPGLGAVGG